MILRAATDAWANQDRQTVNYGTAAKLWVSGQASKQRHAYIFFPRPFEPGVVVLEAILRLRLAEAWGGTQTLTAKRITESWKEGRLNWNNRPAVTDLNSADVNVAALAAGDEVELDLTMMLQDVANGESWFGVRLEKTGDPDRALISSDDPVAEFHPQLDVTWSEAPAPPANLAPAGALAIAKAAPLLTWQFSDTAGDTGQSSSQVQVHSTADFTAPDYDSGKEPNTLPQWDLDTAASPAFTDLSDDEVFFWRVRVWDGTDLVSDWSDPVEAVRKTQGTLAITNPDVPPDNQVNETTPPIAWSLTGRTQEAFGIDLFRRNVDGSLTELARAPLAASTDSSWAVPAGIIRTGDTYLVRVTVQDTIDRQAMAGDPAVLVLEREFTYVREGTPDPVTDLVVTVDGAKVTLEFQRTTDPDFFAVVVDGREIYDRLEPADLEQPAADTFRFDYWLAKPRQEHTYEVEAVVVDGGVAKHSDGNDTADARTDPVGIWLADAADSTGVLIAGKEKAAMAISENSEVFEVLGSRTLVRVTSDVHGYEGSFNGVLLDEADRDTFLDLKGRLVTLRLIIGDLNIPITLGEVSGPMPSPIGTVAGYDVGFTFTQAGEEDEAFEVAGE